MKSILLTDNIALKKTNQSNYSKIYLIDYSTLYIESPNNQSSIKKIFLPKYFMKSHALARKINRIMISKLPDCRGIFLSLIKRSDKVIYEAARIIEISLDLLKDHKNDSLTIKVKNNNLVYDFFNILNITNSNIHIDIVTSKRWNFSFFYNLFLNGIIFCILLLRGIFQKKVQGVERIIILYRDKFSFSFLKPYINNHSILYPYLSKIKFIRRAKLFDRNEFLADFVSLNQFINSFKRISINYNTIKNLSLPYEIKEEFKKNLPLLERWIVPILSLTKKFINLQYIIGTLDATPQLDYLTSQLNENNINLACIPHGINYKYKVNYISLGANIYTFWSAYHKKQILDNLIYHDLNCKLVVTGNPNTVNLWNSYLQLKNIYPKHEKFSKRILVVGEYFASDNYYSSPFNRKNTEHLFTILKILAEKYDLSITVRTRLNDNYYNIAKQFEGRKITISSPKVALIDEILNHNLVITIFSNAIHEALLLNKNVLQINLLGIENYRDLADRNLVYYATCQKEIERYIKLFATGKLKDLDFLLHKKQYLNNCSFRPADL